MARLPYESELGWSSATICWACAAPRASLRKSRLDDLSGGAGVGLSLVERRYFSQASADSPSSVWASSLTLV